MTATEIKPATAQQYWALRAAHKSAFGAFKDYRGENLSFEQASEELARLNGISGYEGKQSKLATTTRPVNIVKAKNNVNSTNIVATPNNVSLEDSFRAYIVSKIEVLAQALRSELGIEVTLQNDPLWFKDNGQRWEFYGMGCGFAYITGYRKTAKNEALLQVTGAIKQQIDAQVRGLLPLQIVMNKPVIPLQAQSLVYNQTYQELGCMWLASQGVTGCFVNSRLD